MIKYRSTLTEVPSSDFTQAFVAGGTMLSARFIWDDDMEQEYVQLLRAVKDLRDADPLYDGTNIIRDYDYLNYYASLPNDIEQALEEGLEYPIKYKDVPLNIVANELKAKQAEVHEIAEIVDVYAQNQFWKCTITDENGEVWSGEVQPGAWINDQSLTWRLRFTSDLDSIGKDDLIKIGIEVEVMNEYSTTGV